MPLLDTLQDGFARFMPSKHDSIPKPMSGGISGGGMIPFDDDVSGNRELTYVIHVVSCLDASRRGSRLSSLCAFTMASMGRGSYFLNPGRVSRYI